MPFPSIDGPHPGHNVPTGNQSLAYQRPTKLSRHRLIRDRHNNEPYVGSYQDVNTVLSSFSSL